MSPSPNICAKRRAHGHDPCDLLLILGLAAALLERHFAAEHAGSVVPLERLGVIAGDADQALVVDVAETLGGFAVAAARRLRIGLDRFLAFALGFEVEGDLILAA